MVNWIKKPLLALMLLASAAAWGQAAFYTDRALGVNPFTPGTGGIPSPVFLAYAQVRVCTLPLTLSTPCPNLASITDIFGNPITVTGGNFGQLTTDVVGRFSFGCTAGSYQVQIAATGSNTPQLAYPITCASTSGLFSSVPGVFTNTQMNELLKSTYGTCNTATEQARFTPGFLASNAIDACIGLPVGATVGSAQAVFGYSTSSSGGPGAATGIAGQGACLLADTKCAGGAFTAGDAVGLAATGDVELFGGLFFVFQNSVAGAYQIEQGIGITGIFLQAPPAFANAINIQGVNFPWTNGINIPDGAALNPIVIGATGTTGTHAGGGIIMHAINGGVDTLPAALFVDSNGNPTISASTGEAPIPCASPRLFSTLPSCTAATKGACAVVTDDNTAVAWGSTITGGGANIVQGWCNGTNWTITGK